MKIRSLLSTVIGALFCLQSAAIQAADWPGYRGATTDGISAEPLNLNWSASPPKVLWKTGFGPHAWRSPLFPF